MAAFISASEGKDCINEDEVKNWVRKKLARHLVPKYVFWIEDLEGGVLPKVGHPFEITLDVYGRRIY